MKKVFALLFVLFLSLSTFANPADYLYTCPTCHVTSNLLNGPHVPAHDGVLHVKLAWKAFTSWVDSFSNPFDFCG